MCVSIIVALRVYRLELAIQRPATDLTETETDEVQLAIGTNGCFGHKRLAFKQGPNVDRVSG